jgi:lipopolysaccharide transport protein LptA
MSAIRRIAASLAVGLLALGAFAAAAQEAGEGVRIGVAPFERVGAAGLAVPDIASGLAQLLSTKGVERVVGPAELGGAAAAGSTAEETVSRAKRAGVDLVVVGRTTRLGESLSVDSQLRSAVTGAPLGTPMVVEASGPSDLGRAIDELATLVLERSRRALGASTSAAAPRRGEPRAPVAPEGEKSDGSGKGQPFDSDAPISIKSDVLEAVEQDGERKFVFSGNVRAAQDDLHLQSDRLEAFYPKGQSQPEQMVATGRVVIKQTGKRALCKKATYFRTEQKLVCVGNAQLDEKCDRVRGKEIVFHLDTEVLEVIGAADVRIHPEGVACEPVDSAPRASR